MATSDSNIDARGKFVNIEDNDDTTSETNVAEDGGIVVDGDVSDSARQQRRGAGRAGRRRR